MARNDLLSIVLLATFAMVASAAPKRQMNWASPAVGKGVALEVLAPDGRASGKEAPPVVVYLKGLATPRIGTESDETILADFLKDGFVVVTVDYAGAEKAAPPHLNADRQSRNEFLESPIDCLSDGAHVGPRHVGDRDADCGLALKAQLSERRLAVSLANFADVTDLAHQIAGVSFAQMRTHRTPHLPLRRHRDGRFSFGNRPELKAVGCPQHQ